MRPLRLLLLSLLAAAAAAQSAATIRIGTWNLEFFGNRRDDPRTDADIAAVGDYLRGLRIDVLAMQEIGTPEALAALARALGPQWRFVLGTTGMWRDGSGGQRLGFLWNGERVELLHAEEFLQLPREVDDGGTRLPIFHRVPLAAAFRARSGGLDFRAVTVHLKADGRRELEQHGRDEPSTRKRIAEARELARLLAGLLARPGEDRDLVLLGDFNHVLARERPEQSAADAKVAADLGVPLLADFGEFARVPPVRPRPTIRWFPEAIDHVVAHRDLHEEIVAQSACVQAPWPDRDPTTAELDAWQKRYSDHFPLTIDLDASRDRDPNAAFTQSGAGSELAAAPPAADAALAPAAAPRAAAFAAGALVTVTMLPLPGHEDRAPASYRGRLLRPLPEAPGGWVALELENGQRIALPAARVQHVAER